MKINTRTTIENRLKKHSPERFWFELEIPGNHQKIVTSYWTKAILESQNRGGNSLSKTHTHTLSIGHRSNVINASKVIFRAKPHDKPILMRFGFIESSWSLSSDWPNRKGLKLSPTKKQTTGTATTKSNKKNKTNITDCFFHHSSLHFIYFLERQETSHDVTSISIMESLRDIFTSQPGHLPFGG